MSAFEVALTPPRIKNALKVSASREPTDVVLGLFSAKSIATFEDIPVTKTARRTLHIYNPTDDVLKVQVTKTINAAANATLEWTSNEIPARSFIAMEIVWNPLFVWSTRETIQFCDNRNFRKDVSVIMKSIEKTQNKKNMIKNSLNIKSHANEHKRITKKLTLKSPSPRTKQQRAKLNALSMANRMTNTKENGFRKEMKKVLGSNNQTGDFPAITIFESCTMPMKNGDEKENTDMVFDSINFTPIRKDKDNNASNVEYLASLPTPNGNATINRSSFFQLDKSPNDIFCNLNETETILTTPFKINDQTTTFSNLQTPLGYTEVDHSAYFDNLHERNEFAMQMTPIDFSFSAKKASDIGIEPKKFNFEDPSIRMEVIVENTEMNTTTSTINRTHIVSSPTANPQLSVIEEEHSRIGMSETYVKHTAHHMTYNLEKTAEAATENLVRDIRLVGTPLKKKYLSMKELNDSKNIMSLEQKILKNNQGSMPNLNKLEGVKSIENNRYFYQSIEKDLQQPETIQEKVENSVHDDEENLGDTSICSIKSTVSVQSVAFQEHEILAQSSQINLNEIGRSKVFKFPSFDRPKIRANDTKKVMPDKYLSASSPTINKTPANNIQKTKHSHSIRDIRSESSSPKGSRASINSSYTNGANTLDSSQKKRMENDSPKANKGQTFRTKTWGSVMPKKFRVPSVPPQRLLLNRPEEKRVILFNPELHMIGVINPDPFAATTVMDPFLSATMYLDERSVDKHEIQFKKWLNALVTLPAEMDENPNQTLDVGTLFNQVKNDKDCTLAPTKETASANYLTKYRMNSLRTAAIALYTSNEMHESLSKLIVHIKRKTIQIRQDRDLHLDVVLQRSILELLLNFNPLWLRIGLEVVFNEIIPMHNNHDMISLSAFILNRLFRDRYLEAKHPKVYALGDSYAEHIKKHTLKKCLCLFYFLDVAKNKKIIKHNPCLFLKKSEYKETKDILLKFSSSLIGNIGDVQRDLKRIGIVLKHKQTHIDEFDYAFRNLAVDLRDGIRLTKVMEIILLRDDMTSQLRAPAISRIQRIHNVGVALKALENADFNLTGKITAADIVDGHREKTLSLLWQIIYKFRAPKFHAAATVIQIWWRKKWLSVCIRRRIQQKIERAATKIQKIYRGFRERQFVKRYREERSVAALTIQRYIRRYLAMKEFVFRMRAIIIIQRWYRNHKVAETSRQQFIQVKHSCCIIQTWYRKILLARKIERLVPIARQVQEESKITVKSAILIQRKFRSYIITKRVRTEFLESKRNAIIIQKRCKALFAMRQQRAIYLKQRKTIIHVQRVFRANVAMKKERTAFLKLKMSTTRIQMWYRACQLRDLKRERYSKLKIAVTVIQRRYRQLILARKTQQQFLELKKAAICIQSHYRAQKAMQKERNKFLDIRHKVIAIQQKVRATILMKEIRIEYLSTLCTIVTLQRRFRAKCLAQKYKKEYENVQKAIRVIQTRYRAHLKMRKQKMIYKKLQSTVVYVQTKYRAKLFGRQVREEFIEYRTAVVHVQHRFRAKRMMQVEKANYLRIRAATMVIQSRWRAQIMKRESQSVYLRMRKAAIVLQRRYRALVAMRYHRNEYLKLKKHTISIQRQFRANVRMQKDRMSYSKLRQSCIVIQQRYRANVLMHQEKQAYEILKKYTIIIQNRFRANRLAEDTQYEYLKMKGAAMTIQQHFRAHFAAKQAQQIYQKWRNAAICLQKHYRNKKLMEMHKLNYETLKSAAITIQRRFRAQRVKKMQQHEYQTIRNAAILIQNRFRANVLMHIQRADYLNLKKAAICFQQRYRAKQLMNEQRADYMLKRCCIIYIQRRYRDLIETRHQRVQYLIKRRSVIMIQRFVRGYLQMKHERQQFISIRTAAIIIQRRFHAHHQMVSVREQYITKILAVRKIQICFRSYLMMRSQREEFLKLRKATLCIQQRYRALRVMQEYQRNYLTLQNAAICIQRRYRAKHQMKEIQNQYKLLKCLVICVQRKYRARLQMKVERESFIRLQWATCCIQQKYRANKMAINQRTTFIHLQRATVGLQAQIRGYLARKQFQMLMTPELIEKRRQTKAAKIIQSFWRGHRIRKTRTPKLRAICEKSKRLQKTASEKNMVKYRVRGIINFLKQRYNVNDALAILKELEYISLTIPHTLFVDSVFIGNFCYGIMSQAIRSEIDKQLISLCCRVLLNLARYKPTQQNVFQIDHFETVAQILYRWCDKDCDIFNVLCTVLYVFIQSAEINQRIREFMVTREAIFLLRETKKLVARKERMRAITPPAWMPVLTPKERRIMPLLETNYGVRPLKKNYIFNCSVFGFDTILSKMNIII